MISILMIFGLIVAAFVGYNIGGSSAGVAFGPPVGSRIVSKPSAATLFTFFALLGGWTVGREVIETMSRGIIPEGQFTLLTATVVLFFSGISLLVTNSFGVPASTSMTAVGAIVGLGLATDTLNEPVMFSIISAWIVAPLVSFWVGALIGRYIYPHLDARVSFTQFDSGFIEVDQSGLIPKPALKDEVAVRDVLGALSVLLISCYNAFAAGASNVSNAVAPLIGNGSITPSQGIILAIAAMGLGAFTIARRTLDTIGEGLTELPVLAALIVSIIGATIITVLSNLGVPASLAVSITSCIIGLGWGRASRAVTIAGAAEAAFEGQESTDLAVGAIIGGRAGADSGSDQPRSPTVGEVAHGDRTSDTPQAGSSSGSSVPSIGGGDLGAIEDAPVLFDPATTSRVVFLWILAPSVSTFGSYIMFTLII